MKTLSKAIEIKPKWTSYMQCFKAVSDFYALEHSDAWVYGMTAHAFIINIHPELCPSAVTCFTFEPIDELAKNLGFSVHTSILTQNDVDFKIQQKETWETAKDILDNDKPIIGWDLKMPEYCIIYGYDKDSYLFYDVKGKPQSIKWKELGNKSTNIINMKRIERCPSHKDLKLMLREVFQTTLDFAKGKKEWVSPEYFSGIKAYKTWIEAIQSGKFDKFGALYNAMVWAECRSYGCLFLRELKRNLNTNLFDSLIEHYDIVCWSLHKVADIFSAEAKTNDPENLEVAADSLFLAMEAEKTALNEMKLLINQL